MKYTNGIIAGLVFLAGCQSYKVEELTEIPQEVKSSINSVVDNKHRPGVVMGLTNPNGTFFYSYGTAFAGEDSELSLDSQFAIGSLTKLFTTETFQRLVDDKAVSYQTKLQDIWPNINDGSDTQLLHLASHKAALPRKIPYEALANNDPTALLATLGRSDTLPANYEYSNSGMAILALALAELQDSTVSDLVTKTTLKPMELKDTGYVPVPGRLVGMHRVMEPVSRLNTTTVEIARGAGGLHSTARDLLKFLSYQINAAESAESKKFGNIGWKKFENDSFVSYYHGGDGNGNQAFIAYRPDNKVGVVILSNSSADDELQSIALHLIDPTIKLPKFDSPPARKYSDEELAPFVGDYSIKDMPEDNLFTFKNRDGRMVYIEKTAEGELVRRSRMYGIDDHQFKLKEIPLTVSFFRSEPKNYDAILKFQDQEYYLVKKRN
ncbi:MAG TPA: serine hydrolase domain-containing protein [Kangiella sp.]